jgi:hypothetical protein
MQALKKYARLHKKKLALEEILSDLKGEALEELKACPDGKAVAEDIEFNLSTKTDKVYPESTQAQIDRIDKAAKTEIKALKEAAESAGLVEISFEKILVAKLPRSVKDKVLAKIAEFRKYFEIEV